eukprot:CAMPEP_0184500028 /NCGR_PEP_ID=MMETSP0113_2-20130426/43388_1 /TAXON_ID=91329 /ORGANISM="Norrisiella sphaerica, Strain BC52" /LENGTH=440 /DNA_ID=CAMNT_0026888215 /DNA_START=169 /DNA_END=1491 /DNA_ORIENTATION=-
MFHYRACYADFIVYVKQKYGLEGELIFETLCKHGKLPGEVAISSALKTLLSQKYTLEEIPADLSPDEAKITKCFELLAKHKLIRRADTYEKQYASHIHVPRKRKIGMQPVQYLEIPKRRKGAVQGPKKECMMPFEKEDPLMFCLEEKDEGEVIWQVYHQHFMFLLRNRDIVRYTEQRLDAKAAGLVEEILNSYPISGNVLRPRYTVKQMHALAGLKLKLSFSEIREMVNQMYSLGILVTDNLNPIERDSSGAVANLEADMKMRDTWTYKVDIEAILRELQIQHAQSIIRSKYGLPGSRIFRLLLIKKRLEEKQVAEMAILPKKEVRILLGKMMTEGYISVQDVPKDANRRPNRMIHLWTVDFTEVSKLLVERFYQAWVNLRDRSSHEDAQIKPTLAKVKQALALSEDEKKNLEIWTKANKRLRLSMLKVMSLIQLFRDYD